MEHEIKIWLDCTEEQATILLERFTEIASLVDDGCAGSAGILKKEGE